MNSVKKVRVKSKENADQEIWQKKLGKKIVQLKKISQAEILVTRFHVKHNNYMQGI